ncbi:MAG: aminopeptidase [Erysipelotrichales bacterium]|nr:aminopeptidase [Erysipelotrichales bacterium]
MNKKIYKQYAEVAVKVGINLQPNQEVLVVASTRQREFVKYVVEACYKNKAKRVTVDWSDDAITRLNYKYQSKKTLAEIADWQEEKQKHMAEVLPCRIFIADSAPDALKGVNTAKMQVAQKARYIRMKKYIDQMDNKYQWTIIAVPSPEWAKKVFPNETKGNAVKKLWANILHTARLDNENPLQAWEDHIAYLHEKSEKLNSYNFKHLTYKSSNGTDFKVGLQENHNWLSARETSLQGIEFTANMPTEEAFTMPAKYSAEGKVVATKPLSYHGQLIEDFEITFKEGKAVSWSAKTNEKLLTEMITTDEGSAYLGEVALVPFNSPINETGVIFLNTLFDENACCHLALGRAFNNNIKGYETMTPEDFKKVNVNESINHVDFMIGSADLEIVGTTYDNQEVTVFKNGTWAI